MAVYKPLFMYLTPASIPQVVAHIQQYLADNPIISDPDAIAEAIQEYIEEHPEIIAVASVNGKVGAVVLTGSDIMINPSSAVSVETQLLNLASMINNTGADITQIQANISQIYTNIETIQTDVETNASNISALQTSVEGQGTRLAAAETAIDNLENAQTAQGTRINAAEGNISSLQTQITQAENDINSNKSNIETLQTTINNHSISINNHSISINNINEFNEMKEIDVSSSGVDFISTDSNVTINISGTKLYRTGNLFYMNLNFAYSGTIPSTGYQDCHFKFNNAAFNVLGGFGEGVSGTVRQSVIISPSAFIARLFSTSSSGYVCRVIFIGSDIT